MKFGINRDRMVVYWTTGDEDLAMALVAIEGFEVARTGVSRADRFKVADVWEMRIVYATSARTRNRSRDAARRHGTKGATSCEG